MPVYRYNGIVASGRVVKGVLDADNPRSLKEQLRRKGIFLSEFSELEEAKADVSKITKGTKKARRRRIKAQHLAEITRQMATLLKAAIPVVNALGAVATQTEHERLRLVLGEVRRAVSEGKSLAAALADHPRVFSDLYVNMIKAGEQSGTLDLVFERLADFTESQARLKGKILGALMYPIVMMFIASGIVSLLMIFVVPRLTTMFDEMGGKLPFITRMLIGVSNAFQNYWYLLFGGLAFLIWAFRAYRQTPAGRERWDRFALKAPVFGRIVRLLATARFARTLATLLMSGVPIATALEIVKHVVGNSVLATVVEEAKLAVQEGESLTNPLEKSGEFPPMVIHMLRVGEKTGQVEEMLGHVADSYEAQADAKITMLTSILEPVLIVIMGVIVGGIVFAIILPMLQLNSLLQGQ